jgi:hypothetical protein
MAFALALAAGCGKSAMERQQEYSRKADTLNAFDAQAVLAGRDPAVVLEAALSRGGCVRLVKGILIPSETRSVVLGADYDPKSNTLRLERYYEYGWGPGTTHRTTSKVTIPVGGIKPYLKPPDHDGDYRCWLLSFYCAEVDCIRYERHGELRSSRSVTDKGSESGRTNVWGLDFSDREAAVEACAALRVLSGRER